jgi:DNA-binding response OmpR family regulator
MMKTALNSLGYDVLVANTVAQGVAIAKSQKIDLYILDFYFPDGIGSDICLEIRRFDQSRPIVFCSGTTSEADRQQARSAGAQAYFNKPCDHDEFLRTIGNLIAGSEKKRAKSQQSCGTNYGKLLAGVVFAGTPQRFLFEGESWPI